MTGEVPRLYELEFLNFRLNQWNETYFSKVFFCLTQQLPSSAKLNILQIDKIYLERGFDPFFAKNKRKVREIFLLSRKDWWNFLSDSLFLSLQSSVDQGFFCELSVCYSKSSEIFAQIKVVHPKYSKHWPYTVAYTINCVCSKVLNLGLNHGLFLSLFKLTPCPIHWTVYVLAYLNFIFEF